jgi:hypothetical protein
MKITIIHYPSFPRRRESSARMDSHLRGSDGIGGRFGDFNFGHYFRFTVEMGQLGSKA